MAHILALRTIFFLVQNFCQNVKSMLGLQPHKGFLLEFMIFLGIFGLCVYNIKCIMGKINK
jgi:hypothetical protein